MIVMAQSMTAPAYLKMALRAMMVTHAQLMMCILTGFAQEFLIAAMTAILAQ